MRFANITGPATAISVAAVLVLAGCGSSPQQPGSTAPAGVSTSVSTPPESAPAAAGTLIDIRIAGGQVSPVNAEFTATVGVPITLRVTSDATDELHVHANPEHSFEVAARPDQRFDFTVDVPGRVEVELHHLDRTVAVITVRP